jgi:poly(A) polymerase
MPLPSQFDLAKHPWLRTDSVKRILDAIVKANGEARFVGGCVRDALIGKVVGDIDLACNLPPEKVSAALTAAGIKVAPTGIEHGTVTAVADHKGYEITTLRRDVETYGRKAKVEFTDDWQADAARRDFTMNALYADASGKIYDYFNGREDLVQSHVRFIGNAEDRIKEDVLRILRFFRFHAWYGKGEADTNGLKACADLASLLPQLSAERVWREVSKFLAAENPAPSWKLLIDHKILPHFLPEASNLQRLEQLIQIEKKYETRASSLARLAALLPKDEKVARQIARKLKMSNRESELLTALSTVPTQLRGKLDPLPFRRALYQHGADIGREAALLLAVEDHGDIEAALAEAAVWEKPVFPIQGEDILELGAKPGPKIGEILRHVEEWWILRDFRPTRNECLAEAKALLSPKGGEGLG